MHCQHGDQRIEMLLLPRRTSSLRAFYFHKELDNVTTLINDLDQHGLIVLPIIAARAGSQNVHER